MISRTIKYTSKSVLLSLYKTLVRPQLKYCTPVWSPHYAKDKKNGVVLLCRSWSTASDLPICNYLHIPEAGSCPGAFPAGLWQRRVGGYSCPPNAPTSVGSECSGNLQSETSRPHHRRTRQPSLAAGPGAHTVYDCSTELQSSSRYRTAIPGTTRVADIPGRRALHSACTDGLELPYFKLSTVGGGAFPVAASHIWNSLQDSRFGTNTAVVPALIENFFISTILHLLAL